MEELAAAAAADDGVTWTLLSTEKSGSRLDVRRNNAVLTPTSWHYVYGDRVAKVKAAVEARVLAMPADDRTKPEAWKALWKAANDDVPHGNRHDPDAQASMFQRSHGWHAGVELQALVDRGWHELAPLPEDVRSGLLAACRAALPDRQGPVLHGAVKMTDAAGQEGKGGGARVMPLWTAEELEATTDAKLAELQKELQDKKQKSGGKGAATKGARRDARGATRASVKGELLRRACVPEPAVRALLDRVLQHIEEQTRGSRPSRAGKEREKHGPVREIAGLNPKNAWSIGFGREVPHDRNRPGLWHADGRGNHSAAVLFGLSDGGIVPTVFVGAPMPGMNASVARQTRWEGVHATNSNESESAVIQVSPVGPGGEIHTTTNGTPINGPTRMLYINGRRRPGQATSDSQRVSAAGWKRTDP